MVNAVCLVVNWQNHIFTVSKLQHIYLRPGRRILLALTHSLPPNSRLFSSILYLSSFHGFLTLLNFAITEFDSLLFQYPSISEPVFFVSRLLIRLFPEQHPPSPSPHHLRVESTDGTADEESLDCW